MLVYFMCMLVYVANQANGQRLDGFFTDSSLTTVDYQFVTNSPSSARTGRRMSRKLDIKMFLTDYQPFETITNYLDQLAQSSPLATIVRIGSSYEGRDLEVIQITASNSRNTLKPIIFVSGGLHGNDYATVTTAIYIVYSLINGYNSNPTIWKLLNAFEFHVQPVANPDGYHYARTVDPTWKKNRSKNSSSSRCIGVNLHHNWSVQLPGNARIPGPCTTSYAGPHIFSEIESHAISNYLRIRKDQIKMYAEMWSNNQIWCSPYGRTKKLPNNYKSILAKSQIAVDAIAEVFNIDYEVGTCANLVLKVPGLPTDWMFDVAGVPYSYEISLRNITTGSITTPQSDIKPIAEEIFAGLKAISLELLKKHLDDNLRNLITGCRCKSKPPTRVF